MREPLVSRILLANSIINAINDRAINDCITRANAESLVQDHFLSSREICVINYVCLKS
jgi:hypothetical protein